VNIEDESFSGAKVRKNLRFKINKRAARKTAPLEYYLKIWI